MQIDSSYATGALEDDFSYWIMLLIGTDLIEYGSRTLTFAS